MCTFVISSYYGSAVLSDLEAYSHRSVPVCLKTGYVTGRVFPACVSCSQVH